MSAPGARKRPRPGTLRRPRTLVVVVAALAACTGSPAAPPASPAPAPAGTAVTVPDRMITLSCAEAGSGTLDTASPSVISAE